LGVKNSCLPRLICRAKTTEELPLPWFFICGKEGMLVETKQIIVCIQREEQVLMLSAFRNQHRFVVLTENESVREDALLLTNSEVILLSTINNQLSPLSQVDKVIIWEEDIARLSRMIEIIQLTTGAPIILVTQNLHYSTRFFQLLGVKYVIYSRNPKAAFLLIED